MDSDIPEMYGWLWLLQFILQRWYIFKH